MNVEEECKKIIAKLKQHELATVKITPQAKAPEKQWSSKFGGNPYWLKDAEYPHAKDGKPLFLLAQINFAEVPDIKDYPTTGLLQFFIKDDDLYGCDFIDNDDLEEVLKNPHGYHVIYHKEVIEDNDKLLTEFVETERESTPLSGEYAISFKFLQEIPSPADYRYEKIIYHDDDCGNISNAGSKIGGYADFAQEDPRRYVQSDNNWLLLFQMDSQISEDVDICWGDAGVANFFIEPERLAQLDFSRTWYNWDCG